MSIKSLIDKNKVLKLVVSYSKKIEKALLKKPKSVEELANIVGKGENVEKAIIQSINGSNTKIHPITFNIELLLIFSIAFLILVELLPVSNIRKLLGLLVILLLPYIWTNELLKKLKLENKITPGLVISELMAIGLITGITGSMNDKTISMIMFFSIIVKYSALSFLHKKILSKQGKIAI